MSSIEPDYCDKELFKEVLVEIQVDGLTVQQLSWKHLSVEQGKMVLTGHVRQLLTPNQVVTVKVTPQVDEPSRYVVLDTSSLFVERVRQFG